MNRQPKCSETARCSEYQPSNNLTLASGQHVLDCVIPVLSLWRQSSRLLHGLYSLRFARCPHINIRARIISSQTTPSALLRVKMASSNSPALSPPPGGDQNRGWQLLVVHSIFSGTVIMLLFARLYTRIFIVRNIGFDDYYIILGVVSDMKSSNLDSQQSADFSQVSSIVSLILDVFQVRWGWGRHTYYLLQTPQSRARLVEASKLSSMNQINTILGLLFIKFSIGILLLRIFGTKRNWRWVIYSIMAFVFVTTVVSVAMVLAQCRPLDKLWNPTASGTCWSPEVVIHIGYYNGG